MATIILVIKGQTCNKLWSYSNYLMRCIYDGDKLVILAPDITIRDFNNFRNCEYVKMPFYFDFLNSIIGYRRNIGILQFFFENRVISCTLKIFQNILNYEYIYENSGSYKDNRRNLQYHRIVDIFKPNSDYYTRIYSLFLTTQQPNILKFGIHIRLGDYRSFENGKYYFSLDIYKHYMSEIIRIFANYKVIFFVSCNESLDAGFFSDMSVILANANNISPTVDMLGLSECDYILGPPSTFSAWAAYMSSVPICILKSSAQTLSLESFVDVNTVFS